MSLIAYDSNMEKLDTESQLEYIQRMCATKDINNMSWKSLSNFLNSKLQLHYSESWYRKNFSEGNFASQITAEQMESSEITTSEDCNGECRECEHLTECMMLIKAELDDQEARINEKTDALKLIRANVADERAANARQIKRLAREENIKEIAANFAKEMAKTQRMPLMVREPWTKPSTEKKEGILLISDWHFGIECENYWNTFNPEICEQRVAKLLKRTEEIAMSQKLDRIHVLNLSDLIAGRIHSQIRIESRFDVITQTMKVSEILADFLNSLSICCPIKYYDCLDNHSRLEPNKKESIDLESMVRIIPWYLKQRLIRNTKVEICDNEFGADIITCQVLGHEIIGVHGDNDRPTNALEKLSLMTHKHYSMLCTAHLHHFSADEQHQSVVVSNGSLMGVDSYAEKLRLTSDPTQTLIIATPDNVCECIYRIVLK